MNIFHTKTAAITLVFMLAFVSIGNESCSAKLSSGTQSAIDALANTIPVWMNKAKGVLSPELSKQADTILAAIAAAAQMTKGGSTNNVSALITSLGVTQVQPFLNLWKSRGKLDQNTIVNAIKGVHTTIADIKKAAKKK